MTDTAQIIEEFNKIHESMNTGFKGVYDRIDKKFNECDERVNVLETERAVRKALCKKKKENRNYWQFIIRAITIAGIVSLFTIAWSKIKAVLDLVP